MQGSSSGSQLNDMTVWEGTSVDSEVPPCRIISRTASGAGHCNQGPDHGIVLPQLPEDRGTLLAKG